MATLLQSTTIGGHSAIHAGNIGSQSVNYANSAGSTAWTNVSGRPTALSQFTNDLGNYGNWITSAALANYLTTSQVTSSMISGLNNMLGVTSLPYSCDIVVEGDQDTYYPVHFIWGDQDVWRRIVIKRGYGEEAPWDPIGTGSHHGGLLLDWEGNFGGWGGADYSDRLRVFQESYTTICADMYRTTHSMGYTFFLRGGGAIYHIYSDQTIRGYQNPSAPDIAYDTNFLFYDSSVPAYKVYAPAPVTTINSSRIDGLRTKKQSQFDGRYLRQGVDISGISNITTSNNISSLNFLASNAYYLNGQSYYLNSSNGGIYTNARFESGTSIVAPGGNSSEWNTAHGWGNHAAAGYLTSLPSHNHDGVYVPINPDGDGPSWEYSDANPTINGTYVGGRQSFGADGDALTGGALQARLLNAYEGHVNSAYGYYVGNLNYGGDSGTHSTTQVIDSSGRWVGPSISDSYISSASTWNTAYGWGNHASAGYIVQGTQISSGAAWTTATRFGSVGDISQDAGNHALSVRSEQGNDAFMSFHIGGDYAVHFGLDDVTNRLHVGGWSDGAVKYQLWDSRDFSSANISNWNTAFGWGNHASAGYLTSLPSHNHDSSYLPIGGKSADSELLDGIDSSRFLYTTGGQFSGDWNTLTDSNQEIRLVEVHNITAGAHSNHPTGLYTYGSVLGWQLDNSTFKLYNSHTGDLAFQTGWNNDGYSGWRTIIHSANIGSQSVSYATSAGSVAWTNVSGRPTALSQFTNDISVTDSTKLPLAGGTMSGRLTLKSISGVEQTVPNDFGAYLHLGDWGVGRTATGAVLVNTAYRADYATDLFDMNISRFTNNSGYITSSGSISGNAATATYATSATRLYASDAPYTYGGAAPYYMAMTYDGSRWLLQVTPGTPAAVRVNYADSAGSASQVSINYNNDSNSTYQLLWGSGNSVYGTAQVYVNPSSDVIYARGGYISPGNPWGTADSAYFPNGITTAGSDNWIYGHTFVGNAPGNGNGHEFWADGNMKSTGHHYLDANYGQTIVGRYSSTVYQGVWAMGDSYKLPMDGSTTGSLYGLAWSHPNAGGVAGNLNTHGLLVMENGTFLAAISGSIRARDDMRAPYFYGSGDIRLGDMWGGAGLYLPSGHMVFGTGGDNWVFSSSAETQAYISGGDGNLWMRWAGDWLSNLLAAKQNASTAINTSNIGSQSVASATRTSGNSGYGHAGTGMWPFFNWGGVNGGTSEPNDSSYTTGISVGSHPNDQAYGFQIANNMWNTGLWTRNYNSGFGSWIRLIDSDIIGSQSVAYATDAGNSNTTSQRVFSDLKINFPSGSGSGHSFASNHYSMGLDSGNGAWNGPHYRDVIIGYHTGVRIGAHYSGVRFYNNSPTTDANNDGNGDGGEALLMTVGGYVGTADHTDVVVNNNLFANVSMRAPIFYDSNDTAFYVDPNSNSRLESLNLSSGQVNAANNAGGRLRISSYTNGESVINGNTHNIVLGPYSTRAGASLYYAGIAINGLMNYSGGTSYDVAPHIWIGGYYRDTPGSERSDFVVAVKSGTGVSGAGSDLPQPRFRVDYEGIASATGSFRAPIFYDSDDTGYYADFNSTSNSAIRVRGGMLMGPNPSWGAYLQVGGNGNESDYATVTATNGNLHLDAADGYGTYINHYSGGTIYFGTAGTYTITDDGSYYNGSVNYAASAGSAPASGGTATALNSSNYISQRGSNGSWNADFQATPAGTMNYGGDLGANGTNGPGGSWWIQQNFRHTNSSNYWGTQVAWGWEDNANRLATRNVIGGNYGSWVYYLNSNNITSYMDAPNKAGTSYYQVNTWLQFNGNHGLYWPSYYGAHLYINTDTTYTQFRMDGNKNGYDGIYLSYSRVNGMMYDSAGNGGVYREGDGRWYWYHHIGNNCTAINTSTTSSSYRAYVGGSLYAEGDIVAYSDRRKKTDIVTIDNALDKVLQLRGVYYTRIDDEIRGRQTGVIAQEINEVLPEVVTYANDLDEYGVSYGNIVGVLIEAIKEQQKEIDELKAKLN